MRTTQTNVLLILSSNYCTTETLVQHVIMSSNHCQTETIVTQLSAQEAHADSHFHHTMSKTVAEGAQEVLYDPRKDTHLLWRC